MFKATMPVKPSDGDSANTFWPVLGALRELAMWTWYCKIWSAQATERLEYI